MVQVGNIVNIVITRTSPAVAQTAFGVPLILGASGRFTSNTGRSYSSLTAVAGDFQATDPEYLAAAAEFGQTPFPQTVYIGQRAANVAGVMTITFSAAFQAGDIVSGNVNGTPISPVTYATSSDATLAAVASAIAALPGVASAVAGSAGSKLITVTGSLGYNLTLDTFVTQSGTTSAIATTTSPVSAYSCLTAINAIVGNNSWYGLTTTSNSDADILQCAAWAQANQKIFLGRSASSGIPNAAVTTDVASQMKARSYSRAGVFAHQPTSDDYLDSGLMGLLLPKQPGTYTAAFKTVAGAQADTFTDTQQTTIQGKNANIYVVVGGKNIVLNGIMSSGDYLDIIVATDWIQSQMQTGIFGLLTTLDKVPFTDGGVTLVENIVNQVLGQAVRLGIIQPGYTISVDPISSLTPTQRQNRVLPNLSFSAQWAGAIQSVNPLNGVISV